MLPNWSGSCIHRGKHSYMLRTVSRPFEIACTSYVPGHSVSSALAGRSEWVLVAGGTPVGTPVAAIPPGATSSITAPQFHSSRVRRGAACISQQSICSCTSLRDGGAVKSDVLRLSHGDFGQQQPEESLHCCASGYTLEGEYVGLGMAGNVPRFDMLLRYH
ncbi:hypothetical protein OE88DRAFT_1668853 [Heliocybe sulcata]|uniref:Uncharacterized protein n=1 Tax=Heliocybe sulcata TaxID=5364 RepID=A0A5C3MLJ3_9AGAM|nr:hypothetical protein OE88DRAFT_1668853 [Heliocybe sulcata]